MVNNIIIAIPSLSFNKLNALMSKLSPITLNISFINYNSFGEKNYLTLSDVSDKVMSELLKRNTKKCVWRRLKH